MIRKGRGSFGAAPRTAPPLSPAPFRCPVSRGPRPGRGSGRPGRLSPARPAVPRPGRLWFSLLSVASSWRRKAPPRASCARRSSPESSAHPCASRAPSVAPPGAGHPWPALHPATPTQPPPVPDRPATQSPGHLIFNFQCHLIFPNPHQLSPLTFSCKMLRRPAPPRALSLPLTFAAGRAGLRRKPTPPSSPNYPLTFMHISAILTTPMNLPLHFLHNVLLPCCSKHKLFSRLNYTQITSSALHSSVARRAPPRACCRQRAGPGAPASVANPNNPNNHHLNPETNPSKNGRNHERQQPSITAPMADPR